MNEVNQLIRALIDAGRQATDEEQQWIIAHVAQAAVSFRRVKINQWLRQELIARGVQILSDKLPSVQLHLLKRIHVDGQWPPETTVAQFTADLHQAVAHPDVQMWTYRWLGEPFAGFLAPSTFRAYLTRKRFCSWHTAPTTGRLRPAFRPAARTQFSLMRSSG